jgi:hypothetical protein
MMVPFPLRRVLVSTSTGHAPLAHPFPVVSLSNQSICNGDFVTLSIRNVDVAIVGKIMCLHGGLYNNRELLDSEFLLQVQFMDAQVKDFSLSVPHPNGADLVYGNIPLNATYIFLKQDIAYIHFGQLAIPVCPILFLRQHGYMSI